ncbi:MAG: class I SAM-dependent methyltransferase [Oscillospiraceae bacterium]|nr:class I SAM-dependent methyltransferase [Oscillospiraceae bacterium]
MNEVNKTLYIPLFGKSLVSRKGIILKDTRAEEIWEKEHFELKGKSKSKWLAYFMAMRARVFDDWLRTLIEKSDKSTVILHIGCGMDSRAERVGTQGHQWFDGDFEDVIECRKKYYSETDCYHMIKCDLRSREWLKNIPARTDAIIVLEGISMYLTPAEIKECFSAFSEHFSSVNILMDCYTEYAAKISKYKNPINDVGVTQTYGIDDPVSVTEGNGLEFVKEHNMTPDNLINELKSTEKAIFSKVFAGSFSKKMYRIYEFKK